MSVYARVVASASYLPGPAITNAQLVDRLGALDDEILASIQVQQRHWLVDMDSGEHRENNSDMAAKAVRLALDNASMSAREIDLLILSTSSPDYLLPAAVTLVQDALGLPGCATLELRSGAAGFAQGLDIARRYIESGVAKTAVVVGVEAISPILAPQFVNKPAELLSLKQRLACFSYGDGAGAVVLRSGSEPVFSSSAFACMGGGKKPGMTAAFGGTRMPIIQQLQKPRVAQLAVEFSRAATESAVVLDAALGAFFPDGKQAREVDWLVLPEGNAGYFQRAADEVDCHESWEVLRQRMVENLSWVGNTGSAALPLALDYGVQQGMLTSGKTVFLLAIETSKWLYGGALLRWTD